MDISALEPTPPPQPIAVPATPPRPFKKRAMKHHRAGLIFPVARIHRHLRHTFNWNRASGGASVYMAAVLEYLTAEMLELAGAQAKAEHKRRVAPRHLKLTLKNDAELAELFRNATIASGGV